MSTSDPADTTTEADSVLSADYDALLGEIKTWIQTARTRAALAVNRELVLLYWSIGRDILVRQARQGLGARVVARPVQDLRREFRDLKSFSRTNLLYMRAFAEAWPDEAIVQQAAGQLPRFHNCVLLDKVKDSSSRIWYARAAIEHGWSGTVLVHQIESRLLERQGRATTNFERTLPSPQSDLARPHLKDRYNFEFLTLAQDAEEQALELGLIAQIQSFLLERGAGFASSAVNTTLWWEARISTSICCSTI